MVVFFIMIAVGISNTIKEYKFSTRTAEYATKEHTAEFLSIQISVYLKY
jgi:hypothetical protein